VLSGGRVEIFPDCSERLNTSEMVSLIATSMNGSARFGIGAGWYEILVKISDKLGSTTDFISAGFVHGYGLPSNTSIENALDGFNGASPNRSTIEGLVGLLNDRKYLSQLASAARNKTLSKLDIPDALRAKLDALGNLNRTEALSTVRLALAGSLHMGDLTEEQLLKIVNDMLESANQAKADAVNKVLDALSQDGFSSAQDVISTLQGVKDIVCVENGFTIGSTSSSVDFSGDYIIRFGRTESSSYNLAVIEAVITIAGKEAFIRGDFRAAHLQGSTRDSFMVTSASVGWGSASAQLTDGFSFDTANGRYEESCIFGEKKVLKLAGQTMVTLSNMNMMNDLQISAWNLTFDNLSLVQNPKDATFTSWIPLDDSKSVVALKFFEGMEDLLNLGQAIPLERITLQFQFSYQSVVLNYLRGQLRLTFISPDTVSLFAYDGAFDYTGVKVDKFLRRILQDNVRVEGIKASIFSGLAQSSETLQILLLGAEGKLLQLITGFEDVQFPPHSASSFALREVQMSLESQFPSWVTLQNYLYTGNMVNLTSGYVRCENDTTMEISTSGWLMYNGQKIELALSATLVPLEISGASVGELRDANGALGIKLLGGSMRIASIAHRISTLEMGVGQRIILKGGTIVRNQTDGFIISNFQLTSSGIALPNIAEAKSQSFLAADSQQKVNEILKNANNYLQQNASDLTTGQLDDIVGSTMSIIGGMIESNNVALNNPLSGDRDAALKYDILNYDKLFLGIPFERATITYVDHLTADEWAFSAAQTRQKALNQQFINTANALLNTIADELVRRQSANGLGSASIYKDSDVIGMNIEYGYASDIFADPLECKFWKIQFPPSLQLLNVQSIPDTQMIQSNFFCYNENPYQYIYNYKPLITSGVAMAFLKIYGGNVIPVQNTLWPITLEATLRGWSDWPTEVYCTEFQDYQVLDIHSFVTTAWNGSLFIDFKKGSGSVEGGEIWIFVAFQRLPGPLPEDHDWRFLVGNQKGKQAKHDYAKFLSTLLLVTL
uniref:Uncharacterized protein n=1 Tax=Parascaris univalens TaxID=6257 RepID=A0A914ZGC9_PARUN